MRKKLSISLYLGLLLPLAAGIVACNSKEAATPAPPETVHGVALVAAHRQTVPDMFSAVGTVQAAQVAQIAPQMMGTITAVSVTEGSHVAAGQVLARIDPAQPQAALQQAKAGQAAAGHETAAAESAYALSESTMQRYEMLHERKSVSAQEYDQIRQQLQAAKARLEMAKAGEAQAMAAVSQAATGLSFTQLRAPFAGVVTARRVDPGAMASPGVPLFTIDSTGRFRMEASVDESSLQFIRQGQTVPVTIDAIAGKQMTGKVVQIYPAGDAVSHSFIVKVELPQDPALRSGLFGRANFAHGERTSILIPQTAVVYQSDMTSVYVVGADGIALLRYVTLGKKVADQVEVLSGLSPDEMIVQSPEGRELGGKRIEVKQ